MHHVHIERVTTLSCPTTALAHLSGTDLALAGSGCAVTLISLAADGHAKSALGPSWTVFARDRIHRIVLSTRQDGANERRCRRALLVGGREVVLVQLGLGDEYVAIQDAHLAVVQRFQLVDFVGDGAFLDDDLVLLSTLHNTVHAYRISPPDADGSLQSGPPTWTRPLCTWHAPQRPTLWTTRFDRAHYMSSAPQPEPEAEQTDAEVIRLAGGSLWGDTFLWNIGLAEHLVQKARDAARAEGTSVPKVQGTADSLQRLEGHKGAVFTVTFSPCLSYLVTGSDDRTLRVWQLPLVQELPTTASKSAAVPHLTLWGHSARVWRACFLPNAGGPVFAPPRAGPNLPTDPSLEAGWDKLSTVLRIASVAEDGTARVWRVSRRALSGSYSSSSAPSSLSDKGYELVGTFQHGHDGRSLWAVQGVALRSGAQVLLTGGADGAVRSWALPSSPVASNEPTSSVPSAPGHVIGKNKKRKIKAFAVAPRSEFDRDLVVTLRDDGSFAVESAPDPPSFYSSTAWAGVSPACTLLLVPRRAPSSESLRSSFRYTLLALSNRGGFLRAALSATGGLAGRVFDTTLSDLKPALAVLDSNAGETDVTVTIAIWDRIAYKLALLEVDTVADSELPPLPIAVVTLPRKSAAAPTALHLLSPTLLLVGTVSGSLGLYSPRTAKSSLLEQVGMIPHLHTDAITDLSAVVRQAGANGLPFIWDITSVGLDGARCITRVISPCGTGATFDMKDRRVLCKGALDQIVRIAPGRELYLGHCEGRGVLLDRLGQQLHSFRTVAKKAAVQLASSLDDPLRYYCLVAGQLEVQHAAPPMSSPAPILLPGLHGREIRAVGAIRTTHGQVLVATAAENGVLGVSRLLPQALEPLWTVRNLPSALKSVAWYPSPNPDTPSYTLFACGAEDLLLAYIISVADSREGELDVVPIGQIGGDGGEVRAMDLAIIPSGGDKAAGQSIIAVGYSDGSLRIWQHSTFTAAFSLLAQSMDPKKCILIVEAVEVNLEPSGSRRVIVTGASDGLLALYDVTKCLASPRIPSPFFTFRPHQSGINALSLCATGSTLLVASGGDDNAISVVLLQLTGTSANGAGVDLLSAKLVAQSSVASAHASTIQGLDFLSPSLVVTSSVEQRLNLYSVALSGAQPPTLDIRLCGSTYLEVADCGAQAVVPPLPQMATSGMPEQGMDRWQVLVGGIGAAVVSVAIAKDSAI